MDTICLSPSTSRVVKVKVSPASSWMGPSRKVLTRISGPLVSKMVATGSPSSSRSRVTASSFLAASSWVQWEKLNRAAFMPPSISRRRTLSSSVAGPSVQMIFVFRNMAYHPFRLSSESIPGLLLRPLRARAHGKPLLARIITHLRAFVHDTFPFTQI